MEERQKALFNRLERSGYLPTMRSLIMKMSAPFWWHGQDETGRYRVFQNGTVCVLSTGLKVLAVTADHVYRKYLLDKGRYDAFGCQFGGSTVEPEKLLIDRNERADLATFEMPQVLMAPAGVSIHHPVEWPTQPVREREVVIYGGYPGTLRDTRPNTVESPFQTFASAITASSEDRITLHLDLPNLYWPLHPGEQINPELGGMSGGGVYRVVERAPIDRVELMGFIYEYSPTLEVMFARHAFFINADGTVTFDK